LTLHAPEGDLDLVAYTWCFDSGCADGSPRPPRPATRGEGPLTFSFPLPHWSFGATLRSPGEPKNCERTLQVAVIEKGDGTFEIPAPGPAGRWQVDVGGYGDEGGDLFTTFVWTIPTASASVLEAVAYVGFLGPSSVYEGRDLEAYGPTLGVAGLAVEPDQVSADLTVTDPATGSSATYPLRPIDDSCPRDGVVHLEGEHPTEELELPALGEPPYDYSLRLVLDGTEYVGTARWPDDLDPPTSNEVLLTWSPPLPAWDGEG